MRSSSFLTWLRFPKPNLVWIALLLQLIVTIAWLGYLSFQRGQQSHSGITILLGWVAAIGAILSCLAAIWLSRLILNLSSTNQRLEQQLNQRTAELQQEVADRLQTETELRQAEERYRGIFENALDGMFQT